MLSPTQPLLLRQLPQLTLAAARVYLALACHADRAHNASPTAEHLARHSGLSVRRTRSALARLRHLSLIRSLPTPTGLPTRYTLQGHLLAPTPTPLTPSSPSNPIHPPTPDATVTPPSSSASPASSASSAIKPSFSPAYIAKASATLTFLKASSDGYLASLKAQLLPNLPPDDAARFASTNPRRSVTLALLLHDLHLINSGLPPLPVENIYLPTPSICPTPNAKRPTTYPPFPPPPPP